MSNCPAPMLGAQSSSSPPREETNHGLTAQMEAQRAELTTLMTQFRRERRRWRVQVSLAAIVTVGALLLGPLSYPATAQDEHSINKILARLASLQSQMDQEKTARANGDATVVSQANTYTNTQVDQEAARRALADAAAVSDANANTKSAVADEATQRQAGDTDTENKTKAYADSQVDQEAARRALEDAATKRDANSYTDTKVADEATQRQAGDDATLASAKTYTDTKVTDEATQRQAGDAATLASAKAYTDQQIAAGSGGGSSSRLDALENKTQFMSVSGDTTIFTGTNVQIVSGSGATDGAINGLGNLIVGYNENSRLYDRSGSHNLVVGVGHGYSSFGGFLAGMANRVGAPYSSVSGGRLNIARGFGSSVSGGEDNIVDLSAGLGSISGGRRVAVVRGWQWAAGFDGFGIIEIPEGFYSQGLFFAP